MNKDSNYSQLIIVITNHKLLIGNFKITYFFKLDNWINPQNL